MRAVRLLYLSLLLFTFAAPVVGQTNQEKVVQALRQGDDDRAVRIGETLVEEGPRSFGLFYNLGLAYRNQGQTAKARAAFEKALLYQPRDLATRRRIREVKERLSPDVAQHDVAHTPWWSSTEAEAALLLAALCVLGLGIAGAAGRNVSKQRLLLAFACFALLLTVVVLTNPPLSRGVLVSSTVRLLEKPQGGSSGPIVPEGVMVEILGNKSHFVEVRTREGIRGWVREAEISTL